jgi:hypothetical protein
MNYLLTGLLGLWLVLTSAIVLAQQPEDSLCGGTQAIYFGNGVWVVSPGDARDTLEDLKDRLRPSMSADQFNTTKFGVAYNRSAGRVSDVLESARQILGNEYPSLLVALLLQRAGAPDWLIPDSLQVQLNDLLRNEAARRFLQGQVSESDVAIHVTSYKADIVEGRKIVVVSHSQGNLFVNLAFEKLTAAERNSFAMIPVASPDSVVRRSLIGHVTFSNDLVIEAVELARSLAGLPSVLPFNDFAESPQTISAHEFSSNYLTDNSSAQFIVNGVLSTLATLPTPPNLAGTGIITVTLTWGTQPDVDLHVFEPNGFHVYYSKPQGNLGFLDVDDVDGHGPEHYFASCQNLNLNPNLAVGTYRVGVNYFNGLEPETAAINLKVPGSDRTVTIPLPEDRGGSGNESPIPVANILVTRNPQTNLFQFEITDP